MIRLICEGLLLLEDLPLLEFHHPRRPRGSQSGRRKGGTKVFKYGLKSAWVPTLTELFPKIQGDASS